MILGDGTLSSLDVYEVDVEWEGEWRRVKAYGGDEEALIGVSLLRGQRVSIDFVPGGDARVEPI